MTTYTGTGAQVVATGKDYDGDAITPDKVTSVTVSVYDTDKTTRLVNAASMTWNADESAWLFEWDTGVTPTGNYETETTFHFPTGPPAVGYGKVKVTRRPVTP